MSRLPRGQGSRTLRPPSGIALPRGLGDRELLDDSGSSALPAFTQRSVANSRRATLTSSTFTPFNDQHSSAPTSRSSTISATPSRPYSGSISPATGNYNNNHNNHTNTNNNSSSVQPASGLALPTPTTPTPKDIARGTVPRSFAVSPVRDLLASPTAATQSRGATIARNAEASLRAPMPGTEQQAAATSRVPRPGSAAGLRCGEPVFIPSQGHSGILRYLGPIDGKQGTWAGVELNEAGKGKNDGSVGGRAYFACPPNTGLFLAPSKVEPCLSRSRTASPADTDSGVVPSITSVLSSATVDKGDPGSRHALSTPAVSAASRTVRLAGMSGSTHRAPMAHGTPASALHNKQANRPRITSDSLPQASLPATTLVSPIQSRRKTLSRVAPGTLGASTFETSELAGAPQPRPPPATVSRATSRTRQLSTSGSVASNRTSSPPLSRPTSVVDSGGSQTGSIATSAAAGRRPVNVNAPLEAAAPGPVKRRYLSSVPPRYSEASGKTIGTAAASTKQPGSNTLPADAADRLRLRVDMLEAENRVLRLKNEQDKAHLAASQMLARDLALANNASAPRIKGTAGDDGATSPPHVLSIKEDTNIADIAHKLRDTQELLAQERAANERHVSQLELQLKTLTLNPIDKESTRGDARSSELDTQADITEKDGAIADLEARLKQALAAADADSAAHAKEISAAKDAHAELLRRFEDSTADLETLRGDVGSKTGEISALNAKLERVTTELNRTALMYQELLQEQEEKRANQTTEESKLVAKLGKQVESLRRDLSTSEGKQLDLASELRNSRDSLSLTKAKVAELESSLEAQKSKTTEYDDMSARADRQQSCLSSIVDLARKYGTDVGLAATEGGEEAGDKHLDIHDSAQRLVSSLIDQLCRSSTKVAELSKTAESKDARITELQEKLADASSRQNKLSDGPQQTDASALSVDGLQARISELEALNSELADEREHFMHEQKIVNDYLEKLESESNRLVEDIEQLTAENQKLVEDLRAASLQNSTVSLDIGSVDAKLSAEISSSSQLASESKAEGEAAASTSSAHATESTSSGNADVEALKLRHRSEMAALKAQLSELERSKNSEIKKLNDEIGSLEDLVEDKIFGESELNDKVSTLSDEVDRLQRELQRAYQNKDSGMPGSNSKPTQKDSSESYASNTGDAGISDDEAAYCSICDEAGHDILDCPSVTGQSHVFKQEASIDSSRPYCDNCESFAGHWTDECPHGDEMF